MDGSRRAPVAEDSFGEGHSPRADWELNVLSLPSSPFSISHLAQAEDLAHYMAAPQDLPTEQSQPHHRPGVVIAPQAYAGGAGRLHHFLTAEDLENIEVQQYTLAENLDISGTDLATQAHHDLQVTVEENYQDPCTKLNQQNSYPEVISF